MRDPKIFIYGKVRRKNGELHDIHYIHELPEEGLAMIGTGKEIIDVVEPLGMFENWRHRTNCVATEK